MRFFKTMTMICGWGLQLKVNCSHGYFTFEESEPGEASNFASALGLELTYSSGVFTFPQLVDAPEYSIEGGEYLGAQASSSFEGKPWEVMRANGLVYDFLVGRVRHIETITEKLTLKQSGEYYVSQGLILPGSLTDEGKRVTDYAARHFRKTGEIKYSWVNYV